MATSAAAAPPVARLRRPLPPSKLLASSASQDEPANAAEEEEHTRLSGDNVDDDIPTCASDPVWKVRAQELFALCDANGDGGITLDEMHHVREQVGLALDADQLQAVFRALDADANGRLSLDEFLAGFGKPPSHCSNSQTHAHVKHYNSTIVFLEYYITLLFTV